MRITAPSERQGESPGSTLNAACRHDVVEAVIVKEANTPVLVLHVAVDCLPITGEECSERRAGCTGAVLAREVEEIEKKRRDG